MHQGHGVWSLKARVKEGPLDKVRAQWVAGGGLELGFMIQLGVSTLGSRVDPHCLALHCAFRPIQERVYPKRRERYEAVGAHWASRITVEDKKLKYGYPSTQSLEQNGKPEYAVPDPYSKWLECTATLPLTFECVGGGCLAKERLVLPNKKQKKSRERERERDVMYICIYVYI